MGVQRAGKGTEAQRGKGAQEQNKEAEWMRGNIKN